MGTTNIYNVKYHFEGAGIIGLTQYSTLSAAGQDYNSIAAVLINNGLGAPAGQTLVIESVKADPSGSQTIYTDNPVIVSDTFTLTATIVGSNMNYVLKPLVSTILFTSSFTIPIPTVPSGGPVDGQVPPYNSGSGFVLSNPTGTPGGSLVNNFLFNGNAITPLALVFYNTLLGGAFQALTRLGPNQVIIYLLSGPQLYSGTESSPTMLAGTFTLTLSQFALIDQNVYKVNYHFEINGKRSIVDLCDYVAAFSQGYDDIAVVMAANNLMHPGVLVIDGVSNCNQGVSI
jgi:hypothetical protein